MNRDISRYRYNRHWSGSVPVSIKGYKWATGTDIMQVTVNAAANIPPVADAGLDQTITLPVNSVFFRKWK